METAEQTKPELLKKNIKYLRKRDNLDQKTLAKELHVTPQAVSKWETKTPTTDIDMITDISELFHVSIDDLMKKDLEVESQTIHEEEQEIAPINPVPSSQPKHMRNVLVFDQKEKGYRVFIITSILFFVFFVAMIPTFFFPYDIFTMIGLFVVFIINIVICVYQIKIMLHRKEVGLAYVSSTIEHRKKAFQIGMPINFAFIILLVAMMIILEEFSEKGSLFRYIYLLVSLLLLSLTESLNFLYYNQILQDAERN